MFTFCVARTTRLLSLISISRHFRQIFRRGQNEDQRLKFSETCTDFHSSSSFRMEFTGVAASEVASQVGAFASNNKAAAIPQTKEPRPALAPADPAVLSRIKKWAIAALGGEPLQLPDNLVSAATPTLANSAPIEIYVRQMACRKPDCVPLETIMVLLGHGWHDKIELLEAADQLKEEEVAIAATDLWQRAVDRAQKMNESGSNEVVMVKSSDEEASQLAQVQTDIFVKKDALETVVDDSLGAPVVLPRDINDYAFDEDEVYVVGTNGRKVTLIAGLEHLSSTLTTLILRSHVISRMEGISTLIHLTKLELYDNQIESLEELEHLKQLTILDMSYNSIRSMAPIANCPLLEEVYLAQNKLRAVEGVDSLIHLRKLDIGGNRIRSLGNIKKCMNLKELWAGKNKIDNLGNECLAGLSNLARLDLQSNRFINLDGIEFVAQTVEELYLARNGLAAFHLNLLNFVELNTIDVSSNRLTSLKGLEGCVKLEEIWASGNLIESQDDIQPVTQLKDLTCIYLEHNPLAVSLGDSYRSTVSSFLPNLTQLDATSL